MILRYTSLVSSACNVLFAVVLSPHLAHCGCTRLRKNGREQAGMEPAPFSLMTLILKRARKNTHEGRSKAGVYSMYHFTFFQEDA